MTLMTRFAGLGAIAGLLASSAALAAEPTRSASALPASAQTATAPTTGVRSSTELRKKSNALNGNGAVIGGILSAAVIAGGIYIAVDDDGNDTPDSPG